MSTPNFKVIMALMESYLVYRQKDWGMTILENGKVTVPASEWNLNKAKTCVRIIEQLDRFTKKKDLHTADWVEFCSFLYNEESIEEKLFNSWPWPINRSHSLLDLIRAIRAYVISTIDTDHANIKIADITKHAASLTTKEDYLAQFFNSHVKVNDPKYTELGETDFESFVKSVNHPEKDKQRRRTMCKSLFNTLHIPVPDAGRNALMSPDDIKAAPAAANTSTSTVIATEPSYASALQSNSTFKKPAPPAPRKQPARHAKDAKKRMQFDDSPEQTLTSTKLSSSNNTIRK